MICIAREPAPRAHASLAHAIRSQRDDIADALLQTAIRRREVTVGSELLALSYVDRFADALEPQVWADFYAWIDRMCDKYAGAPAISRLLTQGIATIGTALERNAGPGLGARSVFGPIAWHVGRIATRPRLSRAVTANTSLDEIDVALDRLVTSLAKFDDATADHSRAVAMWCARIAKKMSLSAAEITYVTRVGLIHDIGKITTPPSILNAPHRLSDPDMEVMRDHAPAGAAIICAIPLLAHLTPGVRGHHERIDGHGYPDGRAGSEIPLVVRIVSVADSFNAMIGNRPYRESQFDTNVLNAMIDVVAPQR
jgi:HD-GYP domain-containing protein (c-di-GMP phosphodiesterase class II)